MVRTPEDYVEAESSVYDDDVRSSRGSDTVEDVLVASPSDRGVYLSSER